MTPRWRYVRDHCKGRYWDKNTKISKQRRLRDCDSKRHPDRNITRKLQEEYVGDCHKKRHQDIKAKTYRRLL